MDGTRPAEIVAVDDELEIRAMIAEYLSRQGYSVRTAEGGARLRRLLAEKPADLVILDINMPGEGRRTWPRR